MAHKTLGWVAMMKKNGPTAQEQFHEELAEEPGRRRDFVLARTNDRCREEAGDVLRTRSITLHGRPAYDGPGALPAEGRKQVDDYLTKAYTGFHGDTSGLAELKAKAKGAAVPPADFKIKSVREISIEKAQAEEEVQQEQSTVGPWKNMKTGLTTDAAYFDQMKGAKLPKTARHGCRSQSRRKSCLHFPTRRLRK